jgi:hypothetical protein
VLYHIRFCRPPSILQGSHTSANLSSIPLGPVKNADLIRFCNTKSHYVDRSALGMYHISDVANVLLLSFRSNIFRIALLTCSLLIGW